MAKIYGRNPVIEALESGQAIDKIYIQSGVQPQWVRQISRLARKQHIPVSRIDRRKMDQISGGVKHQGVCALMAPIAYIPLENLVEKIQKQGQPGSLLMLDRIQDPHNMGAIIRSAEVLGAQGILFSLRDSVPLTETVIKASAGAIFHLDICKVGNLVSALRYLRDCGFWIYSTSSHAEKDLWSMDFLNSHLIILGSEGKGVRPLLQKESDDVFQIPRLGKTESLNVSVACGIILGEVLRQRRQELR
ncbi:MAG: 23S rRNA (guanosine(2251)-2'-O)-methyltransferase RlmB [Calditrichia bacterium]